MKRHHTFAKYTRNLTRKSANVYPKVYVLIDIFEKLRLLHDSFQEEVVGLTLPGEESTHR